MLDFIKPHTAAVLMLFPPATPSPKHSKSPEHSLYCPLLNDLTPWGAAGWKRTGTLPFHAGATRDTAPTLLSITL